MELFLTHVGFNLNNSETVKAVGRVFGSTKQFATPNSLQSPDIGLLTNDIIIIFPIHGRFGPIQKPDFS